MKKVFFVYQGDNKDILDTIETKFNIIYLDPPYNTKSNNLLYKDNVSHKKWKEDFLALLEKIKLKCQKQAVIYCSVGNQELCNAKLALDQVFGEKSLVSIMPRQTISVAKTTKRISNVHDHLLIYQLGNVEFNGASICTKVYTLKDENETYYKKRGKYHLRRLDYSSFRYQKSLDYELVINNKKYYPNNKKSHLERKKNAKKFDWCWLWSKKKSDFAIEYDYLIIKGDNVFKKTYEKCTINGNIKDGYYLNYSKATKPLTSLHFCNKKFMDRFHTKNTDRFVNAKSLEFIKELLLLPKFKKLFILDPYAGSGTTMIVANDLLRNDDQTLIIENCCLIQKKEQYTLKSGIKSDSIKYLENILIMNGIDYTLK